VPVTVLVPAKGAMLVVAVVVAAVGTIERPGGCCCYNLSLSF
jgi:hypothetical protein